MFVVLTLAGTAKTFASAITFFNTGVGANGSALAAGATDSHYNLISNPDGVVETSTATTANAAWVQSARTQAGSAREPAATPVGARGITSMRQP